MVVDDDYVVPRSEMMKQKSCEFAVREKIYCLLSLFLHTEELNSDDAQTDTFYAPFSHHHHHAACNTFEEHTAIKCHGE
jgi:hypothetical protein